MRENKCQYNTDFCSGESVRSRNDTYPQNGIKYIGFEGKQGKHFCPKVDTIQTGPLLMPQDQSKTIIVQGKNFQEPDQYKGQIKLPSRILNVEGRRISSTQLMFNISKIEDALPKGLYEASMKVLWTDLEFNIETSYLTLILYSCADQAVGDCTFCEDLDLSYPAMNCKWCDDQCIYSLKNCSEYLCPAPIVNSIDPMDGSVDGGTHITINGKHIGVSRKQVDNITVAGVLCSNVSIIDRNVQCVTGPSSVSSGPINLRVNERLGVSTAMFTYKDPQLLGLSPADVIQSGGRSIKLIGRNLLIGKRDLRVELIDDFSNPKLCSVEMEVSSDEAIRCVPEPTNRTGPHIIQVFFDNRSLRTLQNMRLTYLSDPVVQSTEPFELKSIYSGGLSFSIVGYGFVEVIDKMTVYFSGNKGNNKYLCLRININRLNCKYPPFPRWMTENSKVQTLQLSLDGFTTTLQPRVLYLKDPILFPFNGNQSYSFDPASRKNEIIIMGDNLDGVATKDDYFIRVGSGECIMTDLQSSNLTCKPPYTEPSPLSTDGKLYIRVQVGFLTVIVGDLIYPSTTSVDMYILIILSITIVIVIAGAIALFAILRWRRLKTRKAQQRQNYVQNVQVSGYEMLRRNRDQADEHRIDESIVNLLKSKDLLISPDDLRIGDCVGKGNFGIVYEGTLTESVDNYETKVAIKSLHQKESRDIDAKEFVNEALQMADFHHPNVMPLIGICLSDEMPLVILPFMRHGDMLTYIRDQNNVMTLLNILQFGVDIASGMEYLSLQRVVHRDLAARNCMLGDDKTVVVADFGLSRDIYEKNYYCISNKNCKLPVKWMAPESLEKGIFTAQSDVWSFGVVLWELVTRGNKPYPEVDGWDMLRFLKMNRKLPQSEYCPDVLYALMTRCWDLDPERRPTFTDLIAQLARFTNPSSDDNYLEPSFTYERLQSTYVNIGMGIDYSDLQKEN
ncbi:macrophage-stimulating protein receptor-like [Saccostrea echinata]|uniref:macrophage-stimulating protein receptor-like n=1 Tax=Saccostrea echinata TaxID=191078 RepID=UPI002A7F95E8|nr:macrophage-stimulating protein receptor-like [Saccostrea echinata]